MITTKSYEDTEAIFMGEVSTFMWDVQAWKRETANMSKSEKADYIDLINEQVDNGGISKDAFKRLKITSWDRLSLLFAEENGNIYSERIQEAVNKRKRFLESRKLNRITGHAAKSEKSYDVIPDLVSKTGKQENPSTGVYPSTPEDVEAYRLVVGGKYNAQRFFDTYAPDWVDKKGDPIKDWKKLYLAVDDAKSRPVAKNHSTQKPSSIKTVN